MRRSPSSIFQYATWLDGERSLGEHGLAEPCGPAEGPFAEAP